jgi:hypothetical protein
MTQPKLPMPRLQLRWKASTINPEYKWECHYELVLPIGKYDIRRENYDDEGNVTKGPCEVVIPMKPPSLRDGNHVPCTSVSQGKRYCDTPSRDGAHASWDSETLGGLPIYVIAPDGMAFSVDKQNMKAED